MNTHELAKELDALARGLRGLTSEASAVVTTKLELDRYRSEPKKLTLAAIAAAISAARQTAGPRATVLRKDVFDRRIDRNADAFATQLVGQARAHAPSPKGDYLVFRLTGKQPGETWYGDAIGYDHSAIAADVHAWRRAASYALARIVPAYGRQELERAAWQRCGGGPETYSSSWRISEKWIAALDAWIDQHAQLRVTRDANAKIVAIVGIDPKPFAALVDAVAAGTADPLGVLTA